MNEYEPAVAKPKRARVPWLLRDQYAREIVMTSAGKPEEYWSKIASVAQQAGVKFTTVEKWIRQWERSKIHM